MPRKPRTTTRSRAAVTTGKPALTLAAADRDRIATAGIDPKRVQFIRNRADGSLEVAYLDGRGVRIGQVIR